MIDEFRNKGGMLLKLINRKSIFFRNLTDPNPGFNSIKLIKALLKFFKKNNVTFNNFKEVETSSIGRNLNLCKAELS